MKRADYVAYMSREQTNANSRMVINAATGETYCREVRSWAILYYHLPRYTPARDSIVQAARTTPDEY